MKEAEFDMRNYAGQGVCVDNTLRDLHNSLYPTKAEFINYFIIHLK